MTGKANNYLGFLAGAGVGSGLMYMLDPNAGSHRRSIVRGKVQHAEHALTNEVDKAGRDLKHRGQGLVARLLSIFRPQQQPDDYKLIARVRSELGRVVSHPRAIHVSAATGRVILHGQVLEHEADRMLRRVSKVRGVRQVDDRVERYTTADNIPSLQGGTFRVGKRPSIFHEEWPPALRLFAGAFGAYYVLKGLRRRGFGGSLMMSAGSTILTRSILNMPARRIFGIGAGYRAVDLQKTITVQAPLEEVYRFWTHIENFPRFMQHVQDVVRIDANRSHWKVAGPAGKTFEWTAEITTRVPLRAFGWRTVASSAVQHQGVVHFESIGDFATRLNIRMSYNPPAGAIGHGIASFLRVDPKTAMDEDLVRMKSLLESGKSRAHGQTVTFDELEPAKPLPVAGTSIPEWPAPEDLERR